MGVGATDKRRIAHPGEFHIIQKLPDPSYHAVVCAAHASRGRLGHDDTPPLLACVHWSAWPASGSPMAPWCSVTPLPCSGTLPQRLVGDRGHWSAATSLALF